MNYVEQPLGAPATRTVEVIGIGRRFVAYLIDSIITTIASSAVGFFLGLVFTASGGRPEEAVTLNLLAGGLGFLITAAYFVAFWSTTGQTIGNMMLGIKVISTEGEPLSFVGAILRYFGYIISGLVLSFGFAWIAFDSKRQGWHDKIANSYVVRKETEFSPRDEVLVVPADPGNGGVFLVLLYYGLICIIPLCVIALLTALGPQIGNVFSEVNTNVQ
jgi:uncharacterized RDD family membrane protein YckC